MIAVQAAQRALSTVTFQIDRVYTEGQHFSDYTGLPDPRRRTTCPTSQPAPAADPRPAARDRPSAAVSLSYPDRDTPAVDDVTLTIRAGQTVAFVGENGSGKTTLAAMIAAPAHARPTARISWNGQPVWTTGTPTALRGPDRRGHAGLPQVAVHRRHQHRHRRHRPPTPSSDRIEAAAARAVAHDMILELPHGYDTLLDRTFADGQDLSGGQWQRITAARGFLRDAELLIMDEPSSALDPRAEDALFQAIRDRQGTSHHDPDHPPAGQRPPRRPHLRPGPRARWSKPAATTS